MKPITSDIVIYKPNGEKLLTASIGAESTMTVNLMQDDYVTLNFVSNECVHIPIGAYCVIDQPKKRTNRKKYVTLEKYFPKRSESNGGFEYQIRFDAWYYNWKRYTFTLNPKNGYPQTSFSYTSNAVGHARLILDQLIFIKNKDNSIDLPLAIAFHFNGHTDTYAYADRFHIEGDAEDAKFQFDEGDIYNATVAVDGEYKNFNIIDTIKTDEVPKESNDATFLLTDEVRSITYDGCNIIDAIAKICDESAFECEWWMDDNDILHFGRCETTDSIELVQGDDFEILNRNRSSDEYGTRLIAFGSTRNVPARYRKSLILNLDTINEVYDTEETVEKYSGYTKDIYKAYVSGTESFSERLSVYKSSGGVFYHSSDIDLSWDITEGRLEYLTIDILAITSAGETTIGSYFFENNNKDHFKVNISLDSEEDSDVEFVIDYNFGISQVNFNNISGKFKIGEAYIYKEEVREILYSCTDSFRKMLPSYFTTVKPHDNEIAIEKAEVELPVWYYNGIRSQRSFRDIKDSFVSEQIIERIESVGEFSSTIKLGLRMIAQKDKNAVLSVRPFIYITDKNNVVRLATYYFDKQELRASNFIEKSLEVEVSTSFITFTTGNFGIGIEYETTDAYEAYVSIIEGVLAPRSLTAESSIVFDDGLTIPVECNKGRSMSTSESSKWLYFDEKYYNAIKSRKNQRFTLTDVDLNAVPVPYFTDDLGLDANISSYTRRIMLPIECHGNYVEKDGIDPSEVVEVTKTFDDIFPQQTFTIDKVTSYVEKETKYDDNGNAYKEDVTKYRFYLSKSKLDFKRKYIQGDETLRCIFQDGDVAGMEFDLYFENDTMEKDKQGVTLQAYRIETNVINDINFPNPALCPKAGDKIVLLNFAPSSITYMGYVADAEKRLYDKAMAYLDKISLDSATYDFQMLPDKAKARIEENEYPTLGQKVTLKDTNYFDENGRSTRVIGFSRCIDIPYDSPTFTLGESLRYSRLKEIEKKL